MHHSPSPVEPVLDPQQRTSFPADRRRRRSISVIICTYTDERWDDLVAAVESLRCQGEKADEIILVVDHNNALLDRVRAEFTEATVVANVGERGLSGARNSGIAAASGEILVFLDDDATAEPDWLERLVTPFEDEQVLGVGGAAVPSWSGTAPAWFPSEFLWVVGCSYTGMPAEIAKIRNVMGCNMALRARVFSEVGGFRSGIGRVGKHPLGCEETELCIRASQHDPDGIFLFHPGAVVRHRVPDGRARMRYFGSRCYAEGISKALVSKLVGAGDALASERNYLTRTLPAGIRFRLLSRTPAPGRFRQAGAIVAGVGMTAAGYARARTTSAVPAPRASSAPILAEVL